jgi:hypothetical protein
MGGGGEADNEESRGRIAKTGDRPSPVLLVAEAPNPSLGDALPVGNQSRAAPASLYGHAEAPEVSPGNPESHSALTRVMRMCVPRLARTSEQ